MTEFGAYKITIWNLVGVFVSALESFKTREPNLKLIDLRK